MLFVIRVFRLKRFCWIIQIKTSCTLSAVFHKLLKPDISQWFYVWYLFVLLYPSIILQISPVFIQILCYTPAY